MKKLFQDCKSYTDVYLKHNLLTNKVSGACLASEFNFMSLLKLLYELSRVFYTFLILTFQYINYFRNHIVLRYHL